VRCYVLHNINSSDKQPTLWEPGALCTGEKGIGKSGKPLHFEGSGFHRVIKGLGTALFGQSRSRLTVPLYQFYDPRRRFHNGERLVNQFCKSGREYLLFYFQALVGHLFLSLL